ncbi:MAG: BLUF domain-containing protein [Sandaracinaceae bacterium]|nr:BLUF domain-containing protein [Sandaracinaceae bacterium]
MALCQLLYLSRASEKMSMRDAMAIVDAASTHNAQRGLTGLLCYGGGYFLQVLEGDGDVVSDTFCRIARDERHHGVRLIDFSLIQARRFEDWSMRLINLDDPNLPEESHRPEKFRFDRTHPFFSTDPQVAFWMLYDQKMQALAKG